MRYGWAATTWQGAYGHLSPLHETRDRVPYDEMQRLSAEGWSVERIKAVGYLLCLRKDRDAWDDLIEGELI